MALLNELLALQGNVPIILDLKEHVQVYQKQLERRIGVSGETIKRSVDFLLEKGFIKEVPYDGTVPNVKSWLVLTDLGDKIGSCLLDCKRKLSGIKGY